MQNQANQNQTLDLSVDPFAKSSELDLSVDPFAEHEIGQDEFVDHKESPSMSAYEPSFLDRVTNWLSGSNEVRASNELAAREYAKEQGLSIDSVYRSAGGSRPMFNPEGRPSGQAFAEGASVVASQYDEVVPAAINTVLRTIRGGDENAEDSALDELIDFTSTETPEDYDENYSSLYGIGESIGYSLTTLGSTALATAATGNPITGGAIGMGSSGIISYRASKDEFLDRVKESFKQVHARDPNQEEWEKLLNESESAASKFGAWEAIPEALGNLIFVKALSTPLKGMTNTAKLKEISKRIGHLQLSEQSTELATGIGQNRAEYEAGLTDELLSAGEILKQQALPVGLTTLGMAGAGHAAKAAYDITPPGKQAKAFSELNIEIDNAVYDESAAVEAVRSFDPNTSYIESSVPTVDEQGNFKGETDLHSEPDIPTLQPDNNEELDLSQDPFSESVVAETVARQNEQMKGADVNKSEFLNSLDERYSPSKPNKDEKQYTSEPSATGVHRVPVQDIQIDPKAYQFRTHVNDQGIDNRLDEVKEWDDRRSGNVTLHRRKDGSIYVADGHHRVNLAKRLGQESINAQILEEADGVTTEDAMIDAAMSNIANDKAEATDIAKVLRHNGGTIADNNLPRTKMAQRGESISKLNDNVFGLTTNGQLSEKDAAVIGESFDQGKQDAAAEVFLKVKPGTEYQRHLLANEINAAEFAESQGEQGGLFGEDPQEVSLMQDRLKVLDSLRTRLNTDKKLFNSLNKNADRASQAGNKIATDSNAEISARSAKSLELLSRVATTPALNALVNKAAKRVHEGEKVATVAKDLQTEILSHERPEDGKQEGNAVPQEPRDQSGEQANTVGNASRESESVSQGDSPGNDSQGQREAREPVREQVEPDLLSSYTEEELQQQEAERNAKQEAKAKAEADAAAKEKADNEVDDFQLSGSDLPADANPNQTDLLDSDQAIKQSKKKFKIGDLTRVSPGELGKGINNNAGVSQYENDIATEGKVMPIEIDEHGFIVDGEHRHKAMLNLGVQEIPVFVGKQLGASGRLEKPYSGIRVKVEVPEVVSSQDAQESDQAKPESDQAKPESDQATSIKKPVPKGSAVIVGDIVKMGDRLIEITNILRDQPDGNSYVRYISYANADGNGGLTLAKGNRAESKMTFGEFNRYTGNLPKMQAGDSNLVQDFLDGKTDEPPTIEQVEQESAGQVEDKPLEGNSEKKQEKPLPKSKLDKVSDSIDAEIDDVAAELAELLKAQLRNSNMGVDPAILALGAKLGALYVSKGVVKFAQYSQAVLKKLSEMGVDPDQVKPMLKEFYAATQAKVSDELFDQMDDMRTVRKFDLDSLSVAPVAGVAVAKSKSLDEFLYENLADIKDNRVLKKLVAEYNGVKSGDVTDAQMKLAQESIELALVQQATDIVASGKSDKATFNALLDSYKAQPNLNIRSSTSMENQAYSTPAPLAYLASKMAGISKGSKTYEPTAGNGMLLIGANKDITVANELESLRVSQLKKLGFNVTQKDATANNPGKGSYDSVIMNPPFGKLRDKDGNLAPVKYDDYTLKSIDHLIAAKALEAMSDNGKASIIIGADKVAGEINSSDRVFFNWLYSNYNVTDHFEIDGKLYGRQGANWPIRIITVNGRVESDKFAPKSGSIERFNKWGDIYEHYQQGLDSSGEFVGSGAKGVSRSSKQGSGNDTPNISELFDGQTGSVDKGSRSGGKSARGNPNSTGLAERNDNQSGNGPGSSATLDGQPEHSNVESGIESETNNAGQSTGTKETNSSESGKRPKRKSVSSSQFQTTYQSRSGGSNEAVLTPNNMAEPLQQALSEIESKVGNIDSYVMEKLGYASKEDLHSSFMGLQVDAVAAAIYNFENKDKGVIIADQTGVGKGRQAAAIIRYAIREGKTPVFVTVTENLFTDMYEDLADIGSNNVNPFILNADSGITKDGKRIFTNKKTGHKKLISQLAKDKALPDDRNALFLTYSQINTPNAQRELLRALQDDAVFVLDESHNAAGEQVAIKKKNGNSFKQLTGAGFINEIIKDKPVVYLSATFAKRPDNMPVYYRTDLLDAVDSPSQLVDAVAAGGVPLQSAMSGMLARSGQLIRRERSFEGISIPVVFDKKNRAEHEKISDEVTAGLRAVVNADTMFHEVFLEDYKEQAEAAGFDIRGAGNKASQTIDHTNFNAVVHNYVRQLLLSLKAEEAASQAIESYRKGVKPVIALENTMGAFIAEYVEDLGLKYGDTVEADYRDVLQKALDRTRRLTIKDDKGNAKTVDIPLSALDPGTRSAYEEAEKVIQLLDIGDFPISPIDLMRKRLTEAGISVAELTGRSQMLDYSGKEPVLAKRPSEESNKRATVNRFNSGALDALIINRSGSTGLSIHASERFKDQRPRHMIVAQTMQDINILVQMLGRINRTGQIELPTYTLMGLDIPAEKRPLAKSARNMKSLNANTSANEDSDSSLNVPDMYNKYGDQVVAGFLAENSDVGKLVGMSASSEHSAYPDMALNFTGRLALLPVKKQEKIYKQIEPAYEERIEYLTKTGQNHLIASTLDTDAKILGSKIVYEGKKPGTIFGGHTTLHKVSIKLQGRPPLTEDVTEAVEKELAGKEPNGYIEDIVKSKKSDEAKVKELFANRVKRAIEDRDTYKKKDKVKPERLGRLESIIESRKSDKDKYETHVAGMETRLRRFKVGSKHRLDLGDDIVLGVVTEIKDSHNGTGDPWASSKIKVRFMVNSGIRAIDIPLSNLGLDKGIHQETILDRDMSYEDMFNKQIDTNAREIRYIATGNLIAGSAKLSGGRIVNFTDDKGKAHQGILMPKKYGQEGEFETVSESSNFSVRDHKVATKFLKDNSDKLEFSGGIFSASKAVKLTKDKNGWLVSVPKANKEHDGRLVKFDDDLRKITGDFFGSGKTMIARFDEKLLGKVAKRLIELTPMYALPSMRSAWEKAGGAKSAKAEKSFDDLAKFSIDSNDGSGPAGKAAFIDQAEANRVIDKITADWVSGRGNISLANSFQDLPVAIKSYARANNISEEKIKGVFHDGKLYVVRSLHKNAEALEKTIFHEAYGHYGLSKLFGQNIAKDLNAIFMAVGGKTGLKKIAKKNGVDIDRYFPATKTLDKETRNAVLVDELLAHLAEDQSPSLVKKVKAFIGKVRAWLREKGFIALSKYNDTDLFHLLSRAKDAVKKGKAKNSKGHDAPVYSVSDPEDLSMSRPSRMERAKEMGYITDLESVIEKRGSDEGRPRVRRKPERSGISKARNANDVHERGGLHRSSGVSEDSETVRDSRGNGNVGPLLQTFYHGTAKDIAAFDLNHSDRKDHGWLGEGVYLTDSPELASMYAKAKERKAGGSQTVIPVHIKANKLYEATQEEKAKLQHAPAIESKKLTQRMQAAGYDGVVLKHSNGSSEIVIFDPSSIRSVNAKFDPDKADSSNILFSLADNENTTEQRRRIKKFYQGIPKQPLDRMFRVPFDAANFIDSHGRLKAGVKLSDKAKYVLKEWKPNEGGKFSWMDNIIETARHGLIDRYKLTDEYKSAFREAEALGRNIDTQALDIIKTLESRGIEAGEAAVLQRMLTGEKIENHHLNNVAAPILRAVDELGLMAVEYGVITREQFERNRGAYLHRSYLKHEGEFTGVGKWILDSQRKHHKRKIKGDSSKGRGLEIKLEMERLLRDVPTDWFGIKKQGDKPDLNKLTGARFVVLDNPGVDLSKTDTFEGMKTKEHKSVIDTIYWPKNKPIPNKYRDYRQRGTFEVRGKRMGKVVLWRDYTKAEREHMGEIVDARYNIAKTFQVISHDIAMGKFFQDVSKNEEWFARELPPGETALSSGEANTLRNLSKTDWVQVPETVVKQSAGTKQWGALSGGYVRAEIWRDLTELDKMHNPGTWRKILTQWKLNKTARSPVVHMNNVMSNIMFMDLADVRMTDLINGLKSYKKHDQYRKDAEEHGAFEGTFVNEELRRKVMEPILDSLMKQNLDASHDVADKSVSMWKIWNNVWSVWNKYDNGMTGFYQVEDEIFRMATYMRRLSLGDSPKESARIAREQFLDYDIRAPWVNAARRTVLPFISYTYRAVPVLAQAIAERPWKLAKYVTLAHLATALAYSLDYGDEDEERRTMRDDQQGSTWLGAPRMARMPWHDDKGNPVFLDIRRWIPAGDVFDVNQGSSALPIPSWIQFGGPLMMASEFMLNKQAFTGREIVSETDTVLEAAGTTADWLYKSWMPSAGYIPGSYYWDKLDTAWNGGLDILGRPYSFSQAFLSSIGIKVQPHDIKLGYAFKSRDLAAQARLIQGDIRTAEMGLKRNLITKAEYNKVLAKGKKKLLLLSEKKKELQGR